MEELLKAQYNYTIPGKIFGPFDITVPVLDGEFLPEMPKKLLSEGKFVKRDVIIGMIVLVPIDVLRQGGVGNGGHRQGALRVMCNTS